jgi:hypothetical protein
MLHRLVSGKEASSMNIIGFVPSETVAEITQRLLWGLYGVAAGHRLAVPEDVLLSGEKPEDGAYVITSGFRIDDNNLLLELAGFCKGIQCGMVAQIAQEIKKEFE